MSVPFCRTKCSYCNFASDVFSRAVFERYIDRVCEDMDRASATAAAMGGVFENEIDSVYIGGGTPSILEAQQFERLFVTVRRNFRLRQDAEITVECAPGTLTPAFVDTLVRCGVNRVSLGVQSFIDREAAAVGRLHKREIVHSEIARLRSAGIANINVDLIAGLPHQTAESWLLSVKEAISTGVPHVSVSPLIGTDISGPPSARTTRKLTSGRLALGGPITIVPPPSEAPQRLQRLRSSGLGASQRGQKAILQRWASGAYHAALRPCPRRGSVVVRS